MMKNRFLLLISLFLVQSVFAQQDAGFYFYSQEDMKNILWKYRLWKGDMVITIFARFIILSLCLIGTALKNTIAPCVKRNGVEWINMTGLG